MARTRNNTHKKTAGKRKARPPPRPVTPPPSKPQTGQAAQEVYSQEQAEGRAFVIEPVTGKTLGEHLDEYDNIRDAEGKTFDELMVMYIDQMLDGSLVVPPAPSTSQVQGCEGSNASSPSGSGPGDLALVRISRTATPVLRKPTQ